MASKARSAMTAGASSFAAFGGLWVAFHLARPGPAGMMPVRAAGSHEGLLTFLFLKFLWHFA